MSILGRVRYALRPAYRSLASAPRRFGWRIKGIEIGSETRVESGCRLMRWPEGVLKVGANCAIEQGTQLRAVNSGQVVLENGVVFRPNCYINAMGQVLFRRGSYMNIGCYIGCVESVEIGESVLFGPHVTIVDCDHVMSRRDVPISEQGLESAPVRIDNGVWLGAGVVVTKGVTIGEGAVVGANAVVTKDIPPYAIAAGVPAKVIRYRAENDEPMLKMMTMPTSNI